MLGLQHSIVVFPNTGCRGQAIAMLYQDAFLQRLETGLRATLAKWGLPETAPVSLLTISENATYVVEDDGRGSRLVLRVHRPNYHTEAEILSELAWIAALRQDGVVETPRPVPAEDGTLLCSFPDGDTRRYVVAFEHMSGKEPDPSDDLVKWYGRLGEINARLHGHSRNWKRPPGFVRKVWTFDTIIGKHNYWGDWRECWSEPRPGLKSRRAAMARGLTTSASFISTCDSPTSWSRATVSASSTSTIAG
jgi:Ser/Thr protein kinase RdoA (MazF antagonist)